MYVCTYIYNVCVCVCSYPDVMMEAYKRKPLAPLFFVVFLIFALYIISNILLAMVYSTFQDTHKKKFKKLYLHRRLVCRSICTYRNILCILINVEMHNT